VRDAKRVGHPLRDLAAQSYHWNRVLAGAAFVVVATRDAVRHRLLRADSYRFAVDCALRERCHVLVTDPAVGTGSAKLAKVDAELACMTADGG
jgi:hypothetical protein